MSAANIEAAARAAADWWAQQVGAPTFRNTHESEPPQDREAGAFAGMLQALLANLHPVSNDTGAAFAEALAKRIESMLSRSQQFGVYLSVDYGPCLELAEVAGNAGVSLSRFPWKTHMRIHVDYVTAALGYGSPDRLVWSATGWERPTCLAYRYEGGQSFDERCSLPQFHDGDHGDWQPDPSRCKTCGLGYTGHYDRGNDGDFHAWEPVMPS